MATSGSFNTGYVGNFYFTFEWYRTGYDSSKNEHYIHYTLTAHNTPGNYRTVYLKNLWINGSQRLYDESGVAYYDGNVVASGDMTISSYNSAGDGSVNATFEAGVGITPDSNCSGQGSWKLDRIPRYTNVYNTEKGKSINSISVNWTTTDERDWTQYSLNGGSWQDAYDTVEANQKNGYYTIYNLQPNTSYRVKTRCRRTDSGLWSEAGEITIKTLDIARVTKVSNIEHGNSLTVEYSNTSGKNIEIGIWKTDNVTELTGGYRSCSGNSYTFDFTDEELDNFYKLYGNNNQITLRAFVRTDSNYNYLDYKEFTITLKGNQKTAHLKTTDWKRAKVWIKKNKVWKKAVVWTHEATGWKRGI